MLGGYFAYASAFTGGVNVAIGDVNGDGTPDVLTGVGAGGGPHVRVFSGATSTPLGGHIAFAPNFTGGVWVAAGDMDGDGRDDIIAGAGAGGGPHVRVFSGRDGQVLHSFFPYNPLFTGGVRVASGDFDGDGRGDILTAPGVTGGPHVRAFDGDNLAPVANFFPFGSFAGGVFVAAPTLGGGAFLHAASQSTGGASVSQAELDLIVAAAIEQWDAVSSGAARKLRGLKVQLADLAGTTLGIAYGDRVLIDADAAGHGWFVDSTPETGNDLDASRIDLLSAVAHELGHVLGLEHGDGVMAEELAVGVRQGIEAVDAVFAEI
jgi:hypothetical protein